ncbi:glycosyltransferase family A protein [uncultured Bacteroides sp.]|uniref:glycosyltransferase family 2 protein n=1 Tax=uncultured Bacteroides sp. TaxID=162156 RepID=UPI00280C1194|nr:glycosyltransferase family A protein [uncultured Bacteroides sp.]
MISIIVPVYNVAKSIETCVKSIQLQDFTDWELLLVNDGSSDDSLAVIQELARTDSRIIVIDKRHSGVSDTRNLALSKMRGEYVCFIDGDDVVEHNHLSNLYSRRDYDMVICGYKVDEYAHDGNLIRTTEYIPTQIKLEQLSVNRESLKPLFLSGMININCNKLLKSSIIRKYNLQYNLISVNEDFYFMLEYLSVANNICTISSASYHWIRVQNRQSGVDSLPDGLLEIYTKAHDNIISFFHNEKLADELMYYSYYFIVLKYCKAIVNGGIKRKIGFEKLKGVMNDRYVKAAFNTRLNASKGEKLMNFLLKNNFFQLFIALNKHIRTI